MPASGPDQIRERMIGSFTSMYLNMLSVIQGLTMGFLFVRASPLWQGGLLSLGAVLSIDTVLIIALTWVEYVIGIITVVWAPTIFDVFIPLAGGITEVLMILSLPHIGEWLFWTGISSILAFCAFLNFRIHGWRPDSGNHPAFLERIKLSTHFGLVLSFIGAAICFSTWWFVNTSSGATLALPGQLTVAWSDLDVGIAVAVGVFTLLFIGRTMYYWQVVLGYTRSAPAPSEESGQVEGENEPVSLPAERRRRQRAAGG